MLTEREKLCIESYLPNPPDPELDWGEYYMLDSADRVTRVRATEIAMGDRDEEIRRPVRVKTGLGVFGAPGSARLEGWVYAWALYDNKTDCLDQTHPCVNGWEHLRQRQREEGLL